MQNQVKLATRPLKLLWFFGLLSTTNLYLFASIVNAQTFNQNGITQTQAIQRQWIAVLDFEFAVSCPYSLPLTSVLTTNTCNN